MTVVARMRRGRGFAARLIGCVLLSAAVTGAVEITLAARLADRAVLSEGLAAARADAAAVQRLSSTGTDPWTGAEVALAGLVARPQVSAARILDRSGSVRRSATGVGTGSAPLPAVDPATREQLNLALSTGLPQAGTRGADRHRLSLVVPTRVGGELAVLQLVVDAGPAATRAAGLRQALILVLVLGALAMPPLALAFGGRRLIVRHRQALEVADVDDLTGIGNRRAFRQALDRAVDDALDQGYSFSLLLVEIHGLGAVNHGTGRRRGDALLSAAAQSLLLHRGADQVFRIGGDGFAVLLPGLAEDQARPLADRLADRLAVDVPPLTALVGACGLDDRCPDAEMLLIGADAALAAVRAETAARTPVLAGGPNNTEDVWDIRRLTGGNSEPT